MSPYCCDAIVFHPRDQTTSLIFGALIHLHDGGLATKKDTKYGKLFSGALIVSVRFARAFIIFMDFPTSCLPPAFDSGRTGWMH
jgi:hypothetical protein